MSVSIDRFVRVLSGGVVVSDELVAVRYNKAQQGLNVVRAQMARIKQAGLQANPTFVAQLQGLEQSLAAAMQQPGNQAKCDALEPLKFRLLAAAEQTKQAADDILVVVGAMRQKAADALAAVNRADQAIQQIPDPAFGAPLATRLATVQNNRINAAAANIGSQVRAAVPVLTTCVTDADTIAAEAARIAQLLAVRAGKLVDLGNALAGLLAVNNTIAEAAHKGAADTAHTALALRRDALANAGPAGLAQEMRRLPALLADIATEKAQSALYVTWGNSKARRDVIRTDAGEYEAAGKRENLPALEAGGAKLKNDLTKLETLSLTNLQAAISQFPKLETDHNKLRSQFKDTVAESQLLQKVKDLVQSKPAGPEVEMQKALGADANGSDVFKQRLLAVYGNARFQGSPEINLLTLGEAVAIHTYTTNDYKQMNGFLYGKTPLDPPDPPLLMPTEDQIKIKNKQAADALEKLPDWTGGMTKRGDRGFPGDDVEFALNNTFTIKGFWSTDKKKPFPGKWQISIFGKTGKNVAMLSAFPKEDEVLFPPGTKFKVIDFDNVIPTSIAIVVEQVI